MGNTSGRPAPFISFVRLSRVFRRTVSCFSSTCLAKFPNHRPFFRLPLCVDREVVAITGGGWRGESRRVGAAEADGAADLPGRVCRTCASCARGVEAMSSPRPPRATWRRRSMRTWNRRASVGRLRDEPFALELGETELGETKLDCAGAWNISAAETGLERLEEILPKHRLGRTSPFRRVPPRVRGRRNSCRPPRHQSRC